MGETPAGSSAMLGEAGTVRLGSFEDGRRRCEDASDSVSEGESARFLRSGREGTYGNSCGRTAAAPTRKFGTVNPGAVVGEACEGELQLDSEFPWLPGCGLKPRFVDSLGCAIPD